MTYKINNTALLLQPTTGKWLPRNLVGIDGAGRAIYEPTRRFQMTWQAISIPDFDQLKDFFENIGSTGSYVIALPQWSGSTYTFYNYSGCLLQEPEVDVYFSQNLLNVSLLITRIWNT